MQENKLPFYDVVIIGAGITGLTLACALADSQLRIGIVDKQFPLTTDADADEGYDSRVSALTIASQTLFHNLQVWPEMVRRRVSAFTDMRVWDAQSPGQLHFSSQRIDADALGYIVENRVIAAALYDKVRQHADTITCWSALSLQEMVVDAAGALLTLSDGSRLQCALVVGADGAHSHVRQLANIKVRQWEYAHSAVVATVTTELPHQATAWQRFLPDGVLAFLPLVDAHTCSIVWSTSPQQAAHWQQQNPAEFCQTLAEHFAYRLGAITMVTDPYIFPLTMRHARQYCVPHVALIGDAIHTLHPLAGQGANLGLLDAACLAEVVLTAQQQQRAIGSLATLRRYERWRKTDNLLLIAVVEALKRVFSGRNALLASTRGAALNLVEQCAPLKTFFMKHGMGVEGDLPSIARNKRI